MLENPETHLRNPRMKDEGNDLLSYITGSKKVSREVASEVAKKSGFDASLIKSLLPMLAPLVIGALGKGISSDNVPVNIATEQRERQRTDGYAGF